MNISTILKGTLYLGFSNTNNLKDKLEEMEDLICNNEDLDLENLRAIYPDIQLSLSKNELDPNLEIREILVSNVIWVGFGNQSENLTIQRSLNDIQNWFESKGSKINGSELISQLKADCAFSHLEFSETKPSDLSNFLEVEII